MLWLLIGGILNAAVSLAYYLRLPYLLFFKESVPKRTLQVSTNTALGNVLSGVLVAAVIALFFRPEWLMQWISAF
jgi:NADH-quinone oxidoreductase subunit N